MDKNLKFICATSLGAALYVAVSMLVKIPVVGHISLDLGYIVLAVYCYIMGPVSGVIVGGVGCTLVSLLASGWFPAGWLLGNVFIGVLCGTGYRKNGGWRNLVITVCAVAIGILCTKTIVECVLYNIPVLVKLPKNAVAFAMDTIVMCIGAALAPKIERIVKMK